MTIRCIHRRTLRTALFLVMTALTVVPSRAGPAAPPPLKEEKPTVAAGVAVRFETLVPGARSTQDARSDRMAALYVPEGASPTPLLPVGPFKATIETDLVMKLRDEITFSVAAVGTVKVTVNDQPLIDAVLTDPARSSATANPVRLNKGKNRIVIQYRSPARGDAMLRLYWAASDFPAEPVPPTLLTHNDAAADVREAARVRAGRELFADLRCAACHGDQQIASYTQAARAKQLSPTGAGLAMPDLAKDAPSLAEIGSRRNGAWLAHWINDPRGLRPDASMPRIFQKADAAGDDGAMDPRALDAAAYLSSLGTAQRQAAPEATEATVTAGGHLFAFLRCAGCHTLPDNETVDTENRRVALQHVKAKFSDHAALVEFLKQPERHYAWIRMPNFRLSDLEAGQLATFLLSRTQKALELPGSAKGDPARGKEVVASSGCLNCHALSVQGSAVGSSLRAPALGAIADDQWDRGCLAAASEGGARGSAPDFSLSEEQRDALLAFLATDRGSLGRESLGRESLGEFSERQFKALNCIACHARDDVEDVYTSIEQEVADLVADVPAPQPGEGEISPDQSEPNLTWVGEKLNPEWSAKLLMGRIEYQTRPWLRGRMPGFPARGQLLAHGLSLQHGFAPTTTEALPPHDAKLADAGRTLTGKEGGLACVTCHGVGPMKATSVFEAPGINLQYVDERITKHYYDRWVYNPLRVHKETKMPAFADPATGKTSITDVLDGDARRQYDAIYEYVREGRRIRPPEN